MVKSAPHTSEENAAIPNFTQQHSEPEENLAISHREETIKEELEQKIQYLQPRISLDIAARQQTFPEQL